LAEFQAVKYLFTSFLKACPRRELLAFKNFKRASKKRNHRARFFEAAKRERSEQGGVKRQYQGRDLSFFFQCFSEKI
jgi:hypothetical protein